METFKEPTTIVGISEIREKYNEIKQKAKKHKVLFGKRNKLDLVIYNREKFEEMERLLDSFEEFILGNIASERLSKAKTKNFLSSKELRKRLKKAK